MPVGVHLFVVLHPFCFVSTLAVAAVATCKQDHHPIRPHTKRRNCTSVQIWIASGLLEHVHFSCKKNIGFKVEVLSLLGFISWVLLALLASIKSFTQQLLWRPKCHPRSSLREQWQQPIKLWTETLVASLARNQDCAAIALANLLLLLVQLQDPFAILKSLLFRHTRWTPLFFSRLCHHGLAGGLKLMGDFVSFVSFWTKVCIHRSKMRQIHGGELIWEAWFRWQWWGCLWFVWVVCFSESTT